MKRQGFEHVIAELVEAAALQTEITQQRLTLEWGQMLFGHAVRLWDHIEAHEPWPMRTRSRHSYTCWTR
jgi:hypothetical protein